MILGIGSHNSQAGLYITRAVTFVFIGLAYPYYVKTYVIYGDHFRKKHNYK